MRRARWMASVALVATLAGCGASAVIKSTTASGSPFCNHIGAFATQAAPLNDAAGEGRSTLLQVLPPIVTALQSLQKEAPAGDTVNTKPLSADIGTMARVMQDLVSELQTTTDVPAALSAVHTKDGQAFTDAVGRFDAYASQQCKVGQAVPTLPSSTTVAPTGPTTTAPASTPTT